MKRFRARVWVHEFDYQLVKVWLEAVDDVTYGWGLVARLHRGAIVTYERRKVNDEVWLPARMEIAGSGRTLVFRGFQLDAITEWSDYKRFSVKTDENFGSDGTRRSCRSAVQQWRAECFAAVLLRQPSPPSSLSKPFDDGVDIVDTSPPGPAADVLQRGPEPGGVGQIGVGPDVGVQRTRGQAFTARDLRAVGARLDDVDGSFERASVDDDPDAVAITKPSDRPARKRLGADVPDARASRDA